MASPIGLSIPSRSVQVDLRKAGTFSKTKKRGFISRISLMDSTTRELRLSSSPFLWLATDIP